MEINKNSKEFKVCDICKINATSLCFKCNSYFCDSCFKFVHDKKANLNHKKEDIIHLFLLILNVQIILNI